MVGLEVLGDKKILDVTCGSRTMWFNKNHPNAIYCDKRNAELSGIWGESKSDCIISPDIQCDFTAQEKRFQEHTAQESLFLQMEMLEGTE